MVMTVVVEDMLVMRVTVDVEEDSMIVVVVVE
jgi:hypothetical protein